MSSIYKDVKKSVMFTPVRRSPAGAVSQQEFQQAAEQAIAYHFENPGEDVLVGYRDVLVPLLHTDTADKLWQEWNKQINEQPVRSAQIIQRGQHLESGVGR